MPSDRLDTCLDALLGLGQQRVWSLVITVFGDLAQEPGQSLDGPVLSEVMDRMGIRPEALRVALHRLRNDGWIKSAKSGRMSVHSLTPYGREQSARAVPAIYGRPEQMATGWLLAVTPASDIDLRNRMEQAGFSSVGSRIFVGAPNADPPPDVIALPGAEVPDWLRGQADPGELNEDYARLAAAVDALETHFPDVRRLSPMDIAVLRALVVHNWRRLVLKHPHLPDALRAPDWPGLGLRSRVIALLDRLPRPAPADLART